MAQEVLDEQDIAQMDNSRLKTTTADIEVDADELAEAFPPYEHHMTVKAKLRELARKGVIEASEIDEIHDAWKENR